MERELLPEVTKRRVIAVIVVIAAHAMLLLLLQRLLLREPELVHLERALILVELRKVLVDTPEAKQPPQPSAVELAPPSTSSSDPSPKANPEVTTPNRRSIDWHGNALRSAEIVAGGGQGPDYRSFGPRELAKSSGDEPPPSIFPARPKHKRGDVDGDVHGDPIVWVNSLCYMTLDKRVQTARDWTRGQPGQFAPAEFTCLPGFGSGEPDGTLFEHIKKREEPPTPREGTEMNALPLRDP